MIQQQLESGENYWIQVHTYEPSFLVKIKGFRPFGEEIELRELCFQNINNNQ